MAPHSSTLAWKIPWMEEPGGLQSMELLRVGHDWATSLSLSCMEKEMATHSSVLAWRISGMAKPGGLPSMGSHRVRHDWSDLAAAEETQMLTFGLFCRHDTKSYNHHHKMDYIKMKSFCVSQDTMKCKHNILRMEDKIQKPCILSGTCI